MAIGRPGDQEAAEEGASQEDRAQHLKSKPGQIAGKDSVSSTIAIANIQSSVDGSPGTSL
jgi:hypothetical protein